MLVIVTIGGRNNMVNKEKQEIYLNSIEVKIMKVFVEENILLQQFNPHTGG